MVELGIPFSRSGRRRPGDPGRGAARARRRGAHRRLPRPDRRLPRAPPRRPGRHPHLRQHRRRARHRRLLRRRWPRPGADSLLVADVPALEAEPFAAAARAGGHRPGADRRPQHARRNARADRARLAAATPIASPRRASPAPTPKAQFDRALFDALARGRRAAAGARLRHLQPGPCPRGARRRARRASSAARRSSTSAADGERRRATSSPRSRHATRNDSARAMIESPPKMETADMAARPIWRGQIRLALVSIPVEIYSGDQERRDDRSSTRSTSRPASASNMRRSCPASARSTATRSSRAMRCRRAITSCSTRRRSRASSSRAARRSTSSSSSTTTTSTPMYFDKPYYVVPADDLAEEAYVVLRDALASDARRSASASWRCAARNMSSR